MLGSCYSHVEDFIGKPLIWGSPILTRTDSMQRFVLLPAKARFGLSLCFPSFSAGSGEATGNERQ